MSCYDCIKCRVSNIGITCSFYSTLVLIIDSYGECVYARVIKEDDKNKLKEVLK